MWEFIIEFIKDVIIFALGFGAAVLRDCLRSKARKKNMLFMLEHELRMNLENVESLQNVAKAHPEMPHETGPFHVHYESILIRISMEVFEAHLPDIGSLSGGQSTTPMHPAVF